MSIRLIQFEVPDSGRRVGAVQDDRVYDLTAGRPELNRVTELFAAAQRRGCSFRELLSELIAAASETTLPYERLLAAEPFGDEPFLHPPVDAVDPHRLLVTGTGLTHLGSMQSRNEMHAAEDETEESATPVSATGESAAAAVTDSARMFQLGLDGGKPPAGRRGAAPEWFYKGNGHNLRGHRWNLELPGFARDGGEEAELVGCYVIDNQGAPRRLGFAVGNEWSDHATERINYLYLAPSKLRQAAVGPELWVDFDFAELTLTCRVARNGETIYDSGPLLTGERHMSHSLANCEDHHFKYPQHRVPGDVHLHFFGTSKLSYGERSWVYEDGDQITIASACGASLVNTVRRVPEPATPVTVEPA